MKKFSLLLCILWLFAAVLGIVCFVSYGAEDYDVLLVSAMQFCLAYFNYKDFKHDEWSIK